MGWCSKLQGDRIRELWPKLTQKLQVAPQVPDSTTVYRWWRKLEEYGWDVRALLPRHHMAGRKGNILEGVLLNLVEDAIEEEYLTQLRQPREEAFKAACALVAAWNEAIRKMILCRFPRQGRYIGTSSLSLRLTFTPLGTAMTTRYESSGVFEDLQWRRVPLSESSLTIQYWI